MQPASCIASLPLVEVLAVRDVGALAPQEDGADRSNGRDHAEGGAEAKAASRGGGIFGLCLHPQEAEERLDRRQEAARTHKEKKSLRHHDTRHTPQTENTPAETTHAPVESSL